MVSRTWKRNDVQIVKENPEDFFCHIDYLFAPDSIWARASHIQDKPNRSLGLVWFWIPEVGEERLGAVSTLGNRG
jgi:hypothetical protein